MIRFAMLVVAVLAVSATFLLPGSVFSADAADDAKARKIVGTWEQVGAAGRTLEFHQDGKYVTKNRDKLIVEGTFEIKGGDVIISAKGMTQSATIQKLAGNEMRLQYKGFKLEFDYKRVK